MNACIQKTNVPHNFNDIIIACFVDRLDKVSNTVIQVLVFTWWIIYEDYVIVKGSQILSINQWSCSSAVRIYEFKNHIPVIFT